MKLHVVDRPEARGTVVLLHGFGAPGDDLVPLARVLDVPMRFVFPEAPLVLGGMYGGGTAPVSWDEAGAAAARAWWPLDLVRLEAELRAGTLRDRRAEVPEGLAAAREQVTAMLEQIETRFPGKLVLGGFSQGAMLALDVALHRETPPAGLVLLSGTIVAESEWQPRLPRLRGVPVFQSHGRQDPLLPFSIAELLRDQLRAAGAALDWNAFVGGHEIPPMVLVALRELLARISS